MKKKLKKIALDTLVELAGGFLIAIGLYNFALHAEFPMTGVSGIALILRRLFGFNIGATVMLLNIPVALLCYRRLGRGFFFRSLRCTVTSSLIIDYIAPLLPIYSGDRLLAAICTGVLAGVGYALIYMRNSSTGGTDFISMAVKSAHPHIPLGRIIFISDATIVLVAGLIFRDIDGIIYGMMITYLYSIVVDKFMYGVNAGKMALIVTEKGEQICEMIDEYSGRGSTLLQAKGGYKRTEKQVVMCACNNKEMFLVEKVVKQIDPKAFTIILESNEVLGEGFKNLRVAELEEYRNS